MFLWSSLVVTGSPSSLRFTSVQLSSLEAGLLSSKRISLSILFSVVEFRLMEFTSSTESLLCKQKLYYEVMLHTAPNFHSQRNKLLRQGWEGVDWMHLAQNRDQCWVLVNTVMNLQVP
jgi:hypothetical protein